MLCEVPKVMSMATLMSFQAVEGGPGELTRVKLPEGFDIGDWGNLEHFYREKLRDGCLQWELDLTRAGFVSSTMLGLLLAFNATVTRRGGSLAIIVAKDSHLMQLLKISRADRILNVADF